MGLPPPGLHPPPVAAGLVVLQDPMVWVSMEADHGKVTGEIIWVALSAGSVTLGGAKALIPINTGALYVKQVQKSKVATMDIKDLRVLPLRFDEQGQRREEFSKAVARMRLDEMPGGGLMLDGPPSALAVMKGIVARASLQLPTTNTG